MPHFSLRVSPAEKIGLIISVSKKTAKQAVVRNLIKRRVRAVWRSFAPQLKPGSYLIIARPGSEVVKGDALEQEFAKLLAASHKL